MTVERCISDSDESVSSIDLTNPHITRGQIQNILGGMRPRNLDVYRRAFVHKSIKRNIRKASSCEDIQDYMQESNETQEFLGDSVLGLIVANLLYEKFPTKNEGTLTRLKTKIVCREGCARIGRKLDLGRYILTSDYVNIDKYTDKMLEDTFEAFVAGVFLDLGFKHAKTFVEKLINEEYGNFESLMKDKNYKDILLRYSQKQGYELPEYTEVRKEGPAHICEFTMSVTLRLKQDKGVYKVAYGKGKSKKYAEQEAAASLLKLLDQDKLKKFVNRDVF